MSYAKIRGKSSHARQVCYVLPGSTQICYEFWFLAIQRKFRHYLHLASITRFHHHFIQKSLPEFIHS